VKLITRSAMSVRIYAAIRKKNILRIFGSTTSLTTCASSKYDEEIAM
jgi:hypothetical protein